MLGVFMLFNLLAIQKAIGERYKSSNLFKFGDNEFIVWLNITWGNLEIVVQSLNNRAKL